MGTHIQLQVGFAILLSVAFSFYHWEASDLELESFTNWQRKVLAEEQQLRIGQAKELLGENFARHVHFTMVTYQSTGETVHKLVHRLWRGKPSTEESRIANAVMEESQRLLFDPIFLLAVIEHESRFNPKARGRRGEMGLMQIRPSTAEWICAKYRYPWNGSQSLEDPIFNIRIGTAYLDLLRRKYNAVGNRYLSAYNLGPNKMRQLMSENLVPKIYAQAVITHYIRFYSEVQSIVGDPG